MNPGSVSNGIIDSIILLEQFYHFLIALTISRNPINTVGIIPMTHSADPLSVYPNPAKDMFKVSAQTWPIDLVIYDLMGREIKRGTLHDDTQTFSVHNLPHATYIVHLISPNESWVERLVVD